MRSGVGKSILTILALVTALSGCVSKPEKASCDQRDWFELGRSDGARGTTSDKLNRHREDCGPKPRSDWDTMYANGRNAGLVEYCSPENALELGKSGIPYLYVCPVTMEQEFLKGYRKGQRARELEVETRQLDTQIDFVTQRLNTAADEAEKKNLNEELGKLQAQKSEITDELERTGSKSQ